MQLDRAVTDVLCYASQKIVDALDHFLLRLVVREDDIQRCAGEVLGEIAPVATNHVHTLDFSRSFEHALQNQILVLCFFFSFFGLNTFRGLVDEKRHVLFLLEQEEFLEHAVEFDLEELVQLVHLLLQLATERLGLLEVVAVCVDEDRIGITIDDLAIVFFIYQRSSRHTILYLEATLLLGKGDGLLEGISSDAGDQHGEGLGVETRVRETETAVHRVGRELERLLADVELRVFVGVNRLVLHQVFHLATSLHKRLQESR